MPGTVNRKKVVRRNVNTVLVVVTVFITILNVLAWNISGFSDWYTLKIYPYLIQSYGRLTGLLPFSVGEVMIIVLLLYLLWGIFLLLSLFVVRIFIGKKGRRVKISLTGSWLRMHGRFALFFIVLLYFIMTCNCFIQYHRTPMSDKTEIAVNEESVKELFLLRNYVVQQANDLSAQVKRDGEGNVLYEGNMEEVAIESIRSLGDAYPELKGYYPITKTISRSEIMSQQYIAGYYFPFSLESNINGLMYVLNKPFTICHELSHVKGFMLEDEANYIGFLACMNSDDVCFQYSGYLGILPYVDQQLREQIEAYPEYQGELVKLKDEVIYDSMFLSESAWEFVDEHSLFSTEFVEKTSDQFMNATLKLNGVEEGMQSYSGVVALLLEHYDGIVY